MRLIDADALLKLDDDGFLDGIGRHELEEAETIDAVPVVRCTDCRWAINYNNGLMCDLHCEVVSPDYYCASGEESPIRSPIKKDRK